MNDKKSSHQGTVLIVDDEPNALTVLSAILEQSGYKVVKSLNVDKAISIIEKEDIDTVITDLKMPGKDGMQLFEHITENHLNAPVIFLTAFGNVDSAVQAVTHGAFYYFIKPPDYNQLKNILSKAVEQKRLKSEIQMLKQRLSVEDDSCSIMGNSPATKKIIETIETIRDSSSSVLVTGETGTGKELVARALHFGSIRRDKPFVAMNCAAIPSELLESELFGYEKGAFTGAVAQRLGKFEEASGGTLFLDEIGELALPLQAKLLRVLQENEIQRLGSNRKIRINIRLIASTNRNLSSEMSQGHFREDLFYRINVVQIRMPSLRERRDDIPMLAMDFIKKFCAREKKVLTISHDAMKALQNQPWTGNVRELKNVIERAVVLAKGDKITIRDFPEELFGRNMKDKTLNQNRTIKDIMSETIKCTLKECNFNKSETAKTLGISRKALYKRLSELNIP